jgi:hypothetical protein
LGDEFGDNKALGHAVAACNDALALATPGRVPLDWAMTQANLGTVLATIGERESSPARLEESVPAYRMALTERTVERLPLDWAETQNNLCAALFRLGARKSDLPPVARFESIHARGRASKLGDGRRQPGQRAPNAGRERHRHLRLEEAVAAYKAALSVEPCFSESIRVALARADALVAQRQATAR